MHKIGNLVMDEGPERVWVFRYSDQYENPVLDKPSEDHTDKEDEYVRADIAKAERDAAFAMGAGAAAKLIDKRAADYDAEHGTYDYSTGVTEYPGNGSEWMEEWEELSAAIRNAAPMTPLQAALALPEVRELVEALIALRAIIHRPYPEHKPDCWHISTGQYRRFGEWLSRADNALAKLEAKG